MPTPFMHLQFAEEIRRHLRDARTTPAKSDGLRLLGLVEENWPAFYLGSIAADYQTICHIPREHTHFHTLPPPPEAVPYADMLRRNPELADGQALSPDRAVFVAAYCAHLMLDIIWFRQVLLPFIAEVDGLGSSAERYFLHNALLIYLDRQALTALPKGAWESLAAAQPYRWLPFAEDDHLVQWRDFIARQLRPGEPVLTIDIYAARMRLSAEALSANLSDADWLELHLFCKVPVERILALLGAAVPEAIALVSDYLL